MKKQAILSSFLVLAMISCQEIQVDNPVNNSGSQDVIHAVCNEEMPETRTVRQEDGKVFWSPNETIGVYQGHQTNGGNKFVSTNTTAQATADFIGTLPSSSGYYWALYPYNPDSWCYNGNYVVTTFSNKQKAVAGSFPDDLYIALARSNTTNMSFKHPLGGIKFSVVNSGIKKITLHANGGEDIAGSQLALDFNDNGDAFVGACWNPWDYIELVPQDGDSFVPGEAYYFVTVPVTMSNGFSLFMQRNDGTILTRNVNKSVTVSRATFRTLMEADKNLSWQQPQISYSPESATVSALGGSFAIKVTYAGDYHLEVTGSDWITADGDDGGNPLFGRNHFFNMSPNTGGERTAVITVCDESNCYPVVVTQREGSSMKTLTHHSLGMRFTATWCGYCPMMNEAFALAKDELGDKFEIVNLHTTSSNLKFDNFTSIASQYFITGYPTGIVDGRALIENYNTSYTASLVQAAVAETEANYPVMTSAGISSSLSGRDLDVNVQVFVREPGDYKITALLLENGIVSKQADYNNGTQTNYVHNNIARQTLTNSVLGDSFTVNESNSTQNFNYKVSVPTSYDLSNMHILVYIQKPFGNQRVLQSDDYGDWYIDNCRKANVGTTVAVEVQ